MTIPDTTQYILFDMDDVIVRSRPLDKKVKERIFAQVGLTWEQVEPYTHLAMKELVEAVFGAYDIDADPDTYRKAYFDEYNRALEEDLSSMLVPGVSELVQTAADRYTIALVTSSTRAQADIVTGGMGVASLFSAFVTAEDVTHSKPHPEPYQKAMAALGASGEQCVVFEDLPTGIASAKAASPDIHVIAITTTNPRENLTQADAIIDSYAEVVL